MNWEVFFITLCFVGSAVTAVIAMMLWQVDELYGIPLTILSLILLATGAGLYA